MMRTRCLLKEEITYSLAKDPGVNILISGVILPPLLVSPWPTRMDESRCCPSFRLQIDSYIPFYKYGGMVPGQLPVCRASRWGQGDLLAAVEPTLQWNHTVGKRRFSLYESLSSVVWATTRHARSSTHPAWSTHSIYYGPIYTTSQLQLSTRMKISII